MTAKKARKERDAALKAQRGELLRMIHRAKETTTHVLERDARQNQEVDVAASNEEVEVSSRASEDLVVPVQRTSEKVMWSKLKLRALGQANTLAIDAATSIEEHDGNAQDPNFTSLMKSIRGGVSVPSHWHMLSEFLSKQADRDAATRVVPSDIEATDIRELRASKDPKVFLNMNRIAFVRCFTVGTPLATKSFCVRLTESGDVFEEGRWYPKSVAQPTQLSKELRDALGMRSGTSPAPWLYAMQHMKRLPPAFPFARVAGVNAPIPEGAQWGGGEGLWGHAPRNDNGSPSFPGVMGDLRGASHGNGWLPWGSIPPAQTSKATGASSDAVMAATSQPATVSTHKSQPATTAAPYMPLAPFQMPTTAQQRAGPVREMEYTKASDVVTGGLVAQGGVLLPRAPLGLTNTTAQKPSGQGALRPDLKNTTPAPSTKF